jgi:hypothetical protein
LTTWPKRGCITRIWCNASRDAHRHAADKLRAGHRRIDDPTNRKHSAHAWHPDLAGIGMHMDLGELGAEGVDHEMFGVRVLRHFRLDSAPSAPCWLQNARAAATSRVERRRIIMMAAAGNSIPIQRQGGAL